MALREEKVLANSGEKKVGVREETSVVSCTTGMNVQNRQQKPLHRPSHQHHEVEVRREKGASEAEASLGSSLDSRAEIT